MSEFEALGEGLNAGAFMAQAAGEGLGVVEARNLMREAGLHMSNATFSSMYADVRSAIGERDAIQGLNYDAIPGGDAFSTWAAGAEGEFATFVTSYVRPVGTDELERRYYIHTTGAPHTPQEAIDAAQTFYTDVALAADSMARGNYQGSIVTSVTRTVGEL